MENDWLIFESGKTKKILKTQEPWIKTYPIFSNPLSILQNREETFPWIYSSFLQIVCPGMEALSFFDFNYRTCPFLTIQRVKKSSIKELGYDYVSFIKKQIDLNNYAYCIVNCKYVKAYQMQIDTKHDLFIFGYDDEQHMFHIADNFQRNPYGKATCTYEELVQAIERLGENEEGYLGFNGCIEFLTYNSDTFYNKYYMEVNIKRIVDSLSAYLDSKPTNEWSIQDYRVARYGEKEFIYGQDCYRYVYKDIKDLLIDRTNFQSLYVMHDHNEHLLRVCNYLTKLGYIKDGVIYNEGFQKLSNDSLRNIIIAYRFAFRQQRDPKHVTNLIQSYEQMKESEKVLIRSLIDELT